MSQAPEDDLNTLRPEKANEISGCEVLHTYRHRGLLQIERSALHRDKWTWRPQIYLAVFQKAVLVDGIGRILVRTPSLREWHVLANGRIYILNITNVSGSKVTATFSSGDINASDADAPAWDETTSKLTFTRVLRNVGPGGTGLWQPFTGYLLQFHCNPKPPSHDCDPKRRMAGIFQSLDKKCVPLFPTSGWYATIPNPNKVVAAD